MSGNKKKPAAVKWFAAGVLVYHVALAARHKKSCPKCRDQDFAQIVLAAAHLWEVLG